MAGRLSRAARVVLVVGAFGAGVAYTASTTVAFPLANAASGDAPQRERSGRQQALPSPTVTMLPAVARLGQVAVVAVHGLGRRGNLEVRLEGSTTAIGLRSPWVPLRMRSGVWSGPMPLLERRGVYPIELRQRAGAPVMRSKQWLFRVLAVGTLSGRSFATPEQVARSWVRDHGTLVALKRWPMPALDHRLPAMHQLMVAAYSPPGDPSLTGRLGIFITAVRTSFRGPWRFLEATVQP